MCGIVAALSTREPVCLDAMRRALGALALRGPDGEGLASLAGGRVALGHRRLALVDPVGGAQPLASEDGQIVAVVNGELYDEGDVLRRRLEARGHRFVTGSDSELLVHLYAARGSEAVAELRGEFAFALFDAHAGALWLGRDRFGKVDIGRIVAAGGESDGVFARVGQDMELVRTAAADAAGVRRDRAEVEAAALEDPAVGRMHQIIGLLQ